MTRKTLRWKLGTDLGQLCRRASHLHYVVEVIGDPFAPDVPRSTIDYLFAIIASRGSWSFRITTDNPAEAFSYMATVERRSVGAAEKYERRVKSHFRRYKMKFTEGYSLPAKPTPQLRVIYDSAAKTEKRPANPDGTTLQSGFSLGEYHWRDWPLDNVTISEAKP